MAIFLLECKEMATRVKKVLIWMVLLYFEFRRLLSFFLACLSLWLVNKKVRNRWRGVDKLYGFYLLCHASGQTHVCLIASSVKIFTKCVAVVYWFKSARMVLFWDLYACSLAVICQYSYRYQVSTLIDWKIEFIMYGFKSWTMKYATFYASTNGLARFSTCNYNLPIQLLLCVKSPDNKHIKCLGNN